MMNRQNCVMICMSVFLTKVTIFKMICHCLLYDFLKLRCDQCSCKSKFKQLKILARKKKENSGFQRYSNPWPLRYRCSALPELWRPICWEQTNVSSSSCWNEITTEMIAYQFHLYSCNSNQLHFTSHSCYG